MGDFNPFRSIPLNSYDLAVQRKRQEDLARSSRIAAERSANASPAKPKVFSKEQADQIFAAYGKRFGVVDTGLSPQEIQNLQDMGESPENIQRLVEQDRQRAVTFALAHMSDPTAGQVVKETATPAGLAGALNSAALGLPEAIVTATSSPEQRQALEEWKKQNPGYGYGGVVGDIASMAIPTGAILKMGGYAAKAFNAKEVATSLFNAAKYASGAPSAGSFMVAAAEQAVPRGVATALQTGDVGQGLTSSALGTVAAAPFGKVLKELSKTAPKLAEDVAAHLEGKPAEQVDTSAPLTATQQAQQMLAKALSVLPTKMGAQINKALGFDLEQVLAKESGAVNSPDLPKKDTLAVDTSLDSVQEPYGGYTFKSDKNGNLTLTGDPDEIRSLLPANFQGTAGEGKITFTSTSAPQVKAILEGADNKYSRAGKVEDLPVYVSGEKIGQYIGAPEIANTPETLPGLLANVKKLAMEGEKGKMWYENSGKAFLKLVGGSVALARKLAAVMAIYSPQTKVIANSTMGVRSYAGYHGDNKIDVKTAKQDDWAAEVLANGKSWGGEKTNNFFRNLMRVIDPQGFGAAEKQGITVDMWMMRAFGYQSDAPTAAQYRFVENESNRLAKELGWEPQQFQAAVWVAMKARQENELVKAATNASSFANGWAKLDKNGKLVVLNDAAHKNNWFEHALAHTPTAEDTAAAKFDFADGIERHMGQVSWEARPSRKINVLAGIHNAPYDQQVQFQKQVESAFLDENGNDILAQKLGLLRGDNTTAPGIWKNDISSSTQTSIVMAPGKGEVVGKVTKPSISIDASQKKILDTYSAIKGLLLRQDGVGYHRPFWSASKSDNNGLDLSIGRPLTDKESKSLNESLDKKAKEAGLPDDWWDNKGIGLISTFDGMRIINFGAGAYRAALKEGTAKGLTGSALEQYAAKETEWAALTDTKKTIKLFEDAANDWNKTIEPDIAVKAKDFHSDGNLVENNWEANPDGNDYISRISEAERSDILRWATDVLGPKIQQVYEDAANQYKWGDPGRVPGLSAGWRSSAQRKADERMTELLSRSARIPTMLESNDRQNRRQSQ